MLPSPVRVLIIDDDEEDVLIVRRLLAGVQETAFEVDTAGSFEAGLRAVKQSRHDAYLVDYRLDAGDGIQLIREAVASGCAKPLILLTGQTGGAVDVEAISAGAADYLAKGQLTSDMLVRSIRYCLVRSRAEQGFAEQVTLATLISEVGVILTGSVSLQTMINECSEVLVRHLDAAFARIWIYDESKQVLILWASAGMYTHLNGPHSRVPLGRLKIGLIAQERKPHLTNAVTEDPRVSDREWARRERMVAFAGNPLVVGDRLVGVMALFSRKRLSVAAAKALSAVADQIALGIQRKWGEEVQQLQMALLEATPDFVGIALPEGRIRYINRGGRELCGIGPDEDVTKLRIYDCHPQWLAPLIENEIIPTALANGIWSGEAALMTRGEKEVPVSAVVVAHRRSDGRLKYLSMLSRDLSAQKQAEQLLREKEAQLRHAQKLEAVGALAGGVAHEFNNLLQAISGYTGFALSGLSPNDQPYQDLQQVQKAAKRAADLTRQLLTFGRRQGLERTQVNLNDVVSDLRKMLRPLIGEHIELRIEQADDLKPVYADAALIQQMLVNLCVNARDAMPQGGVLTVKVENTALEKPFAGTVGRLKAGRYVRLTVEDTGTGMRREVKDRVFDPFFTTKQVGAGTGLGLAMVHGTVEQHGGAIEVESEPGRGTNFRVYLPLSDGRTKRLPENEPEPIEGGHETILIAEDARIVRKLAARILEEAGYQTFTAADGEDAVRVFRSHADQISLALLDVVIPKLSGRQVFEQIRAIKPDVKVVFCTAYDPDTDSCGFLAEADLPLVRKPFQPDVLLKTLRDVLDRKVTCRTLQTAD